MTVKEVFKTKIWPVIFVILLMFISLLISGLLTNFIKTLFPPESLKTYPWISSYAQNILRIPLAITIMLLLGGGLRSYGFNLKSNNLYVPPAILSGILLFVIMTVVDHLPSILWGAKIRGYPLDTTNMAGQLLRQWLVVGTSEEILFRGLAMTYLMRKFQGHIRFFKWDIHVAGVIIAVLFALAHVGTFWSGNLIYAVGQQIYGLFAGLALAYLFEKSKSLLAPIIFHNVANGLEISAVFILVWLGF
jgi:membrane protease YdiL (CAAX protease family)